MLYRIVHYYQDRIEDLEDSVRRLERMTSVDGDSQEYLKNVVLNYMVSMIIILTNEKQSFNANPPIPVEHRHGEQEPHVEGHRSSSEADPQGGQEGDRP